MKEPSNEIPTDQIKAIPKEDLNESLQKDNLKGIRGWLLLPLLGLFFGLYQIGKAVLMDWNALSTIDNEYMYIIYIEGGMNLILLGLTVFCIYLFSKQDKRLPMMYIGLLLANLLASIGDEYLISFIGIPMDFAAIGKQVVPLIVWGLYFLNSTRVKNTFVN